MSACISLNPEVIWAPQGHLLNGAYCRPSTWWHFKNYLKGRGPQRLLNSPTNLQVIL